MSFKFELVLIAPSKNCVPARAYAMRVLRLRMLAVKNSTKRRLARSPWARIMDGSASSPARASAGGGAISSLKMMGSLDTLRTLPVSTFLRITKDVMAYY